VRVRIKSLLLLKIGKANVPFLYLFVVNRFIFTLRNRLITTPFAPLIQDYQKCNTAPTAAFVNQLGISMGAISAMTPLIVITLLVSILIAQFCFGRRIPIVYRQRERQIALNALATSLLLTRDRKNFKLSASAADNDSNDGTAAAAVEDEVLLEIVQSLEKDANLYNNAFKLQAEVDDMTTNWRDIKFQQQQHAFSLRQSSIISLSSPITSDQSPYQINQAIVENPLNRNNTNEMLRKTASLNQPRRSIDSVSSAASNNPRRNIFPLFKSSFTADNNNSNNTLKILNNGKYYRRPSSLHNVISTPLPSNYENPEEILHWITSLLSALQDLSQQIFSTSSTNQTNPLLDEKAEGNIWYLINETIMLKKISDSLLPAHLPVDETALSPPTSTKSMTPMMTTTETAHVRDFQKEFFPLVYQLLLHHLCILLSIPVNKDRTGDSQNQSSNTTPNQEVFTHLYQLYQNQYGYQIGNEIFSLHDLYGLISNEEKFNA
jgi:hypothetical protein